MSKSKPKTKIAAEIWLDYLDGELEKSFKEDLDRVIANDKDERRAVFQLRNLKAEIRRCDQLSSLSGELPPDEVFDCLKNRIMSEISNVQPLKQVTPWKKSQQRGLVAASAAIFVLGAGTLVTQKGLKNHRIQMEQKVEAAAQNMVQNEGIYNEVIVNQQGNEDFMFDAIAEKLSQLPEGQAKKVIENL